MSFLPIQDHGVIGNMRTAALVGTDGTIDWLCLPHFDSPSVFASILDESRGGHFRIQPTVTEYSPKQLYWPDTNVLVTRFLTPDGIGEILDYMPVATAREKWISPLVRRVRVTRGRMTFRLDCRPAFNYGRDEHRLEVDDQSACFFSSGLSLRLATHVPLRADANGVTAEFTLNEGETHSFTLHPLDDRARPAPLSELESDDLFRQTVQFWRNWIGKSTYEGRWREMVNRSALALKLLTFEPTGAIVAAPTCSLPERIGGERNWDYRYSWIRDSTFTLYALMRIGISSESERFMQFIEARCHERAPDGSLQLMYGIDGRHVLTEETLENLAGYKGSRPVRIGNEAYSQLQLDIYGELMDSVYLYNKYGAPISYELWITLRDLLDWLCDHWKEPDNGIWEFRGGKAQLVYSKVMCWVAFDRGLRLAGKRSFPADRNRWLSARDEIYDEVMREGWNDKRQAFVEYYGGDLLDASTLIMPLVFFMAPTDPRMLKTIDAIAKSPKEGGLTAGGLVYRYHMDPVLEGLHETEGTFNICSFWLVEALTRAGRNDPARLSEARLLFEQMLGYANHLGLYAEETGPRGEGLGNFPQAFTHLALISAAYNLDRALGAERD